jgi:hypothetical protein
MAGGWNLKFAFWYLQTTHEPLHLGKQSLVQLKIMDIPTSFTWIIILGGRAFEYGDGGILKLMQTLGETTWDHEANRASKDKQIVMHFSEIQKIRTRRAVEC